MGAMQHATAQPWTARSSPGWGIACRQVPSPCQRRAVLSSLALATRPSAVAAHAYTRAVWPSKILRQVPAAFQSRRVVSWLPDTMPLPGTRVSALHMHDAELAVQLAIQLVWIPTACSHACMHQASSLLVVTMAGLQAGAQTLEIAL